jgi:hypothetical protein
VVPRLLATALSLNRIAFGLAYALIPERSARGWIGRVSRDPAAQVFVRGHGARDVALGVGALVPLIRGDERAARPWMAGQALADGSDIAATLAAGKRLPRSGARFALTMAGVSTAVATGTAATLGRRRMS